MGEETEAPTGQRQDLSLQAGGVEGRRDPRVQKEELSFYREASRGRAATWNKRDQRLATFHPPSTPPPGEGAPRLTFAPLAGHLPLARPDPGLRGSVLQEVTFSCSASSACALQGAVVRDSCIY